MEPIRAFYGRSLIEAGEWIFPTGAGVSRDSVHWHNRRNTEGTLNYNPRVHKFGILFTPQYNATVSSPAAPNLKLQYIDTIKFSGPDGAPCTGLDGDATGHLSYTDFPDLPVATYEGDGFGGEGPGGKRIAIDPEGL